MSLQWPNKLCNGILWMVLGEERGHPARRGDQLWNGSANYILVGIKEFTKKNIF